MGLLPDIEEGKIVEKQDSKLYTPPVTFRKESAEARLGELNNLGRDLVTEDFSDSAVFRRETL